MPSSRDPDDDSAMAELVNMAGEGLPYYLWSRLAADGEDRWLIGRERARREHGAFSYRNAVLREVGGRVAACLIGYPLPDEPEPVDYTEMPPLFVPLQQLEDLAPGTWYVNVLATRPECRRRGYASDLLEIAARLAETAGRKGLLSIIVAGDNRVAHRLYERAGFRERAMKDGEGGMERARRQLGPAAPGSGGVSHRAWTSA